MFSHTFTSSNNTYNFSIIAVNVQSPLPGKTSLERLPPVSIQHIRNKFSFMNNLCDNWWGCIVSILFRYAEENMCVCYTICITFSIKSTQISFLHIIYSLLFHFIYGISPLLLLSSLSSSSLPLPLNTVSSRLNARDSFKLF